MRPQPGQETHADRDMALRRYLCLHPASRQYPLRPRGARVWRRYPVRQPAPGLRPPVSRVEVHPGGTGSYTQWRRACVVDNRRPRQRVEAPGDAPSGSTYAPRQWPQGALRQPRLHPGFCRHDRRRKRAAVEIPLRTGDYTRSHDAAGLGREAARRQASR